MAEEQADPQSQKQPKAGGGGMIPALLVIVLMPVISFAMFKFAIIPMIKAELPEEVQAAPVTAENLDIQYDNSGTEYNVTFDPVVTNVKGTSQTRFVQVVFTVYSANPRLVDEVELKRNRMTDVAIGILGNLTLADLEQPQMKNIVRNQLKQGFNHVMGKPLVEDISFSQFVVQ